jgi:hypothetical protein
MIRVSRITRNLPSHPKQNNTRFCAWEAINSPSYFPEAHTAIFAPSTSSSPGPVLKMPRTPSGGPYLTKGGIGVIVEYISIWQLFNIMFSFVFIGISRFDRLVS